MLLKYIKVAAVLLPLFACTGMPAATVTPFPSPGWSTATMAPSPTFTPQPTRTPPPLATPTETATPQPLRHIVVKGEDMFGIALRYGVSLEAVKTANPEVNPYSMAEGQMLTIPLTATPLPTDSPTLAASAEETQEPLPVFCHRDAAETITCIVSYHNQADTAVENPSATVIITAVEGDFQQSLDAILPLNVLPAGQTLPLVVRFTGPTPASFEARAFFKDQLPVMPNDDRYLSLPEPLSSTEIEPEGRWAKLKLQLPSDSAKARSIWLLAVAWNAEGQPIGWRRVDLEAPFALDEAIEVQVFSLDGRIARVSLNLEARPLK